MTYNVLSGTLSLYTTTTAAVFHSQFGTILLCRLSNFLKWNSFFGSPSIFGAADVFMIISCV